jgi:hypothetical protein
MWNPSPVVVEQMEEVVVHLGADPEIVVHLGADPEIVVRPSLIGL